MDFSTIIGIDVSKLTLDIHVLPNRQFLETENDEKGINRLMRWLQKDCMVDLSDAFFAFECTGYYSYKLAVHLQERGYHFIMLPGLELKRSLGISRGKTDKIDAEKIAEYTYLRRDRISPTQLPEKDIMEMKRLLSLRDRLVRQRAGYKVSLGEAKRAIDPKDEPLMFVIQEDLVKELTININRLDKRIKELVDNNLKLKNQYDLIVSIKGVGPQTAFAMIAFTHAFQKFPTWRKFACYAGIAPFPYRSGTSIQGKTRISHLANKKVKSLLGNITGSAIQHNPEMKTYYKRRIQEGKHKMSTQNIIRNKLIARIFAVVERGTPYVEIMKYAA